MRRGHRLLMRMVRRVSAGLRYLGSSTNPFLVVTHHKVKGVLYEVINDEIEMEEDPKGEEKVDAKGNLLGGGYSSPSRPDLFTDLRLYVRLGREYKVWTLKSKDRNDPERLYALSIDVARTVGFADSSFMLRRLPLLVKVSMTPAEKEQAVEAGRVSTSMKYRSVTMIPIRNVYKYLGAKIVKGTLRFPCYHDGF